MPSYPNTAASYSFALFARSFAARPGCPFADCLSEQRLQRLADEHGLAFGTVFTPAVTLWAFLCQCLSASKSCASAVARVLVLRVGLGLPPCSENPGAYCKARAKLPVAFLRRLTYEVADEAESQAPADWLCQGRHVHYADGTTVSGPDTEANQAAYPQSANQKPGLGFPLLRLVVLLSAATAMVRAAACGPFVGKGTGETSLLKGLLDRLGTKDILVADSYYCVWWLFAQLHQRGIGGVFRLHQTRKADFAKGNVLGPGDHVVNWNKPADCPAGLTAEEFAALPPRLEVREVLVQVQCPGFRPKKLVVATNLLKVEDFSAAAIRTLYLGRWNVELDIRSIKQTLKMEILRGKTPEMLRREIWGHLLAYNLIRQQMAQAALARGRLPRQLSLALAQALLNEFRPLLLLAEGAVWQAAVHTLQGALAQHVVGKRPGRREPRKLKRRPKDCKLLNEPRRQAQAKLLQGEQED